MELKFKDVLYWLFFSLFFSLFIAFMAWQGQFIVSAIKPTHNHAVQFYIYDNESRLIDSCTRFVENPYIYGPLDYAANFVYLELGNYTLFSCRVYKRGNLSAYNKFQDTCAVDLSYYSKDSFEINESGDYFLMYNYVKKLPLGKVAKELKN